MGFLSDTELISLMQAESVRSAWLLFLDFKDDPTRVWEGVGTLKTNDANTWSGIGELGSISGLEQTLNGSAPVARLALSGVDPDLVTVTKNAADQIKGRDVTVYGQFFDDDAKPLGSPFSLWSGVMDQLTYSMSGEGPRTISVTAEGLFTRRGRPAFGLLTDRDQKARFAGDRGLEFVGSLANKTVTWPDF